MKHVAFERCRLERRVLRDRQASETRKQNVASPAADLVGLEVPDAKMPQPVVPREAGLLDDGPVDDVVEFEFVTNFM